MVFTLQRFTKKPPVDYALELEFDVATGLPKEDKKHLLDYDRPNYKIYPVQRNGKYLPPVECAFCG